MKRAKLFFSADESEVVRPEGEDHAWPGSDADVHVPSRQVKRFSQSLSGQITGIQERLRIKSLLRSSLRRRSTQISDLRSDRVRDNVSR